MPPAWPLLTAQHGPRAALLLLPPWLSCASKVVLPCRAAEAATTVQAFSPTSAKQSTDGATTTKADAARDGSSGTYSATKASASPWWYGVLRSNTQQALKVHAGGKPTSWHMPHEHAAASCQHAAASPLCF